MLIGGLLVGLFIGASLGFLLSCCCAVAGRTDDCQELYATQLRLAAAEELNRLLVERIQELEDKLTACLLERDLTDWGK